MLHRRCDGRRSDDTIPSSGFRENTRAKIRKGAADLKGKAKEKIAEGLGIIEEALEEE